MEFQPELALQVLGRTPATLRALLDGLSESWTRDRPGAETWSPYDVIGHLVHGEETDWIPRARIILTEGESRVFEPFDRFAQFDRSEGRSLGDLLERFSRLRRQNLDAIARMEITGAQWELRGTHPDLGTVTLRQLIATWVVHDLNHLDQIVRGMAKQYAGEVGPWKAYLPILDR
jgi:hypothetical protein